MALCIGGTLRPGPPRQRITGTQNRFEISSCQNVRQFWEMKSRGLMGCLSSIGKWATAFYTQVWRLLTFYHKQVRKRKSAKERRTRNQHLLSFARYVHIGKSNSILAVFMLPRRFNWYWDSIHGFRYWQNLRHVTHKRQNWDLYDRTNSQSSPRRSPPPSFRASTNDKVRASHHPFPHTLL